MADFVAVLKRTIDGVGEATPEVRQRVYDKARATIEAKLAAIIPPPSAAVAARQRQILEDAIALVEADYATPLDDPFAELENAFARIDPSLRRGPPTPLRAEPIVARPSAVVTPRVEPTLPGSPTPLVGDEIDGPDADDPVVDDVYEDEPARRRRSYGGLVAAGVVLALLLGGGYAAWTNQDAITTALGIGGDVVASDPAPVPASVPAVSAPVSTAAAPAPTTNAGDAESAKFTQRLNEDGSEIDEGPAGGAPTVGEGTSVAAVTQLPTAAPIAPQIPEAMPETAAGDTTTPETPPAIAAAPAVPAPTVPTEAAAPAPATETIAVGQKAIYYEESTNVEQASAQPGGIVWSLIQQSPGGDLPPEPAIRAEATIPDKDLQLRMTISRNTDKTLPASHIIELIFLTPENFAGGGIENILRFTMKDSEQATGSPLIGMPAKIADGFFLMALNDTKAETDANLRMMERESWIDVPVVYKSGRRALITLEKGIPGTKVFDEAIKAWQVASAAGG